VSKSKGRWIKVSFRADDELHEFMRSFARKARMDEAQVCRTALDLIRLYYLGEATGEGKGLEAVRHILESLAARIAILSDEKAKRAGSDLNK